MSVKELLNIPMKTQKIKTKIGNYGIVNKHPKKVSN